MMKISKFTLLFILFSTQVFPLVGKEAPSFKLMNENGKEVSLSKFQDKIVVLEWLNHGCPFVKKHYGSGNMQSLQKKYTDKGIIWLSIISSAEDKQGYVDSKGAKAEMKKHGSLATHVLLDPTGKVGKQYQAKTTPHMYILNKKNKDGKVLVMYEGAIDSKASTDQSDIKGAKNFISDGLDELLKSQKITVNKTKPYGCSVKYE